MSDSMWMLVPRLALERRGVGRVRHLGTRLLQEQQTRKVAELMNVEGLHSSGDIFTNKLSCERISIYSDMIGYRYHAGRARSQAGVNFFAPVGESTEKSEVLTFAKGGEAKHWCRFAGICFRSGFRDARSH